MLEKFLENPDVLKIIAAPLVGLVPVLISLLMNWLDKRSFTSKRNAELIYVNQRVSFLSNWYNIQEKIGDSEQLLEIKSRLAEDLQDVYDDFTDALVEADNLTKQRKELIQRFKNTGSFRRYFLLYTPYSASGWVYHTLYYMCLFPFLVWVGIEIYQFLNNTRSTNDLLYLGISLVLLVLLFRFLGRRAAIPVEERLATNIRKSIPRAKSAT
jgi:hypothetical protein